MANEPNRREFLGTAGMTGASLAAGLAVAMHVPSATADESPSNGDSKPPIRLAVMGVHGRGKSLVSGFGRFPEVEIAYICDPDRDVIPAAVKIVEERGKPAPKTVDDFRVALDDPHVDALVCAAPDHWHALATIWACQAGKDVYVEKPVSHNILEGRAMIAAARKYERIVQAGTQRRNGPDYIKAIEEIRSGRLGKVHMARAWIVSTRPNIGHVRPSPPPANLNFDLWCGPAPDNGYKTNLVHYDWHWRWDYGTGECGNNGIHALDVARWGMGVDAPETICCGGGKYSFDDDQETPDTQLATFGFKEGCIHWEHRTWSKRGIDGEDFGIEFYGANGTMLLGKSGWKVLQGDKEVAKQDRADYERPHLKNFLDCVRSRERPNADIEIAHLSTQLCHLANIAWRTGSTLHYDPTSGSLRGNEPAQALMGRTYRKGFELPREI